MAIEDKINTAIRILKIAAENAKKFDEPVEIAYSGGKDSDVLLRLAQMSGIEYRAIYKNTTIDPPGTIQHVRDNNVEIRPPKQSFFALIRKKGFPTMFRRFCCAHLKEYPILKVCAVGVRTDESVKRKKRYTNFNYCQIYRGVHTNMYLPIWDWSLDDVREFVLSEGVKLAPHYYNADGSINFARRLGCMGCPLKSDRGVADFKAHPAILRAWIRAGMHYVHTHTQREFNNVYELFVSNVFFNDFQKFKYTMSPGLFGDDRPDCKAFLERTFNTKLP